MDLGSLNMENIENIISSMSSEDMEMLKNAAEGLFAAMGQKEEKRESRQESNTKTNIFDGFNIDFETVTKIMSLMEKLRHQPQDPRCNLLIALKPMLTEKRQGKVDEAIKMMSLLSFLPIIDELRGS